MKKEPNLPSFPNEIFATSARVKQASIRALQPLLTQLSLSGYSTLFNEYISGDFLQKIDTTKRQRAFGCTVIFWAWLAQILEQNASCNRGLTLVQNWCRALKLPIPSSDTSSYCKARQRLSLSFLKKIHAKVLQTLISREQDREMWRGFRLKAFDGCSVKLLDTEANQKIYPQPTSQPAGCDTPVMGFVGLLNLSHGGLEQVKTCRHTRHDSRASGALVRHLGEGDLLLADRAFCSYQLLARCREQGAHTLMRLNGARHRALSWKKGKRIGKHERLVTWKRPQYSKNSGMGRAQWEALPATMEVRLIKMKFETRTGEMKDLVVVTSLVNCRDYPAAEVIDLYARRWEIEVRFRDVKTTLRMEEFAVKHPKMAHKTLLMSVIAFNLLKGLMQQAAQRANKPLEEISFKGCLDVVVTHQEGFRKYAGKRRSLKAAREELLELIGTKLVNIRPFRREPRAVKRRPKAYPLLNKPRAEYVEIAHRSRYTKPA